MTQRILIIRPDKIGDLILTLPMATVIKSGSPESHVAFLVREYTASLLSLAADVDEVVLYDASWSLWRTVREIRSTRADVILIFGSKFKLTLASFIARVPIRVGRAYWWYSFLFNRRIFEHRKNAERNEAEYNVRMLESLGFEYTGTPLPKLKLDLLPTNELITQQYAVLHVTTGGSAPVWGIEKFIDVAKILMQDLRLQIVLTGLPEEHEFLFRMGERMKLPSLNVHIHTQNDLLNLASVLSNAALVISGSTGPGHLAAALGTPTIGIFPAVVALSKERWGFRGTKVVNLSPLTRPNTECPKCINCTCISEITTSQVIQATASLDIL